LILDGFRGAATLGNVAAEAAIEAFFVWCFYVDLEVELVAQGLPIEAEEAFYEDHWTGGDGFCGFETGVGYEAVAGLLDAEA
jgi:hypothetical protein